MYTNLTEGYAESFQVQYNTTTHIYSISRATIAVHKLTGSIVHTTPISFMSDEVQQYLTVKLNTGLIALSSCLPLHHSSSIVIYIQNSPLSTWVVFSLFVIFGAVVVVVSQHQWVDQTEAFVLSRHQFAHLMSAQIDKTNPHHS